MEGTWKVYFEDKAVGNCRIIREGLYFRIVCRCGKVTEGISRLILQCGDQTTDLGVLVPVDGGFGLDKRLPAKHLPQGQSRFFVKVPRQKSAGRFVPVRELEPFAHLSELMDARFARRNGEAGVILKNQSYCETV